MWLCSVRRTLITLKLALISGHCVPLGIGFCLCLICVITACSSE
uniref:Uncharacterized protein n=1 Tax=Anguilla anguilla TaxID=7936 RepID=A0A0E9W6I8_ANGAN